MHRRPLLVRAGAIVAAGSIAGCLDDEPEDDDVGAEDDVTDDMEDDDAADDTDADDVDGADDTDTDEDDSAVDDDDDADDGDADDEEATDDTDDDADDDSDEDDTTDDTADDGDDTDDEGDEDGLEVTIETVDTDCAGEEVEGGGNGVEGGEVEDDSGNADDDPRDGDAEDGEVGQVTIESTEEGATVRGTIGSPTPCYEARVTEQEVEDGELTLRIGVEDDGSDLCMECLGAIEYETTVTGDVDRVVVEHERVEDDPAEVADEEL